jgi:hypothetical protein
VAMERNQMLLQLILTRWATETRLQNYLVKKDPRLENKQTKSLKHMGLKFSLKGTATEYSCKNYRI